GAEALTVSQQFAGPIHLLVTDVVMPKMSGRQLVERLVPLRPAMKVLYLSGYSDEAVVRHGALDPGVPFLQKPYSTEALARRDRDDLGLEWPATVELARQRAAVRRPEGTVQPVPPRRAVGRRPQQEAHCQDAGRVRPPRRDETRRHRNTLPRLPWRRGRFRIEE